MIRFLINIYVVPYLFYMKKDRAMARMMAQLVCTTMVLLMWANGVMIAKSAMGLRLFRPRERLEIIYLMTPISLGLFFLVGLLARVHQATRSEEAISNYASTLTTGQKHAIMAFFAVNGSLYFLVPLIG